MAGTAGEGAGVVAAVARPETGRPIAVEAAVAAVALPVAVGGGGKVGDGDSVVLSQAGPAWIGPGWVAVALAVVMLLSFLQLLLQLSS